MADYSAKYNALTPELIEAISEAANGHVYTPAVISMKITPVMKCLFTARRCLILLFSLCQRKKYPPS